MVTYPRVSMTPMSPVCNQPSSSMVSAVATGSAKYPGMTL